MQKRQKKVQHEMYSSILFFVKVAFFCLYSYVFYTVQVCILYHLDFVFVPPRSLSCGFDQDGTGSAVQTQMSPRINQIFSFPAEMPLQVVHFKVLTMGKVVIEKLD